MANTYNFIQPPPNSTGLKIDTAELTNGSNLVERQVIAVGDPATAANVGNVALGIAPASGYQLVGSAPLDGYKATYSAAVYANAPAATPTDFWTILGSATKTIRILRIWVAARATAATWMQVALLKYGAAYTGGTAAAATIVPHDSSNPAATAVVNTWTSGLPTVGATLVGAISNDRIAMNALTLTSTQPFISTPGLLYDFTRASQALVLRGITQYVSLNGQGAALPSGGVLDIKVEWTEE